MRTPFRQDRSLARGRGRRLFVFVDRHPLLTTMVLAAAGFLLLSDVHLLPSDFRLFSSAGSHLLHGHLAAVFADPETQAGPLALVLVALLGSATGWLGSAAAPALLYLLGLINAGCLVVAVRAALRARTARRSPGQLLPRHGSAASGGALLATGLLAVALGTFTVNDTHPTHALIATLWFFAARRAQRGAATHTGVLLALACGLDTWGVLGVGVVLLLPTYRAMSHAAGVALVGIAACWLPFVLAGPFRSFDMHWTPAHGSLPEILFGAGSTPWSYRALQGAAAIAVGCVVAWRMRPRSSVAWMLPACVVAVRLFSDPINFLYYEVPLQLMLLVGIADLVLGGSLPFFSTGRNRRPGGQAVAPLVVIGVALLSVPIAGSVAGPALHYATTVVCLGALVVLLAKRCSATEVAVVPRESSALAAATTGAAGG